MKFLHLLLLLVKFMSPWNHNTYYGFTKAAQQELIQILQASCSVLVLILFSHLRLGLASVLPIGINLS